MARKPESSRRKGKRNSPAWREFEKLASTIERVLAPNGAIVRCPDKLRDLVTGRMREVDASVKYKIGSVPILITIECRERGRTQDDTWIEQLAKKKEKIGAAKTIAVASNGFSKSAVQTAEFSGIELRTIGGISATEIRSWCELDCLHYAPPTFRMMTVSLLGECGLRVSLEEICRSLGINSEKLNSNGPLLSSEEGIVTANDILSSWQRQHAGTEQDLLHGLTPGSEPVSKEFCAKLEPGKFWLAGSENRLISAVVIGLTVKLDLQLIPAHKRYRYAGAEGTIADGVEFVIPEFQPGSGQPVRVVFQKTPGGEIAFSLTLEEKNGTSE